MRRELTRKILTEKLLYRECAVVDFYSADSDLKIWSLSTSMLGTSLKKQIASAISMADKFEEKFFSTLLTNHFEKHLNADQPVLLYEYDGGEDRSEAPTKLVCLMPRMWKLMGSIEAPWTVCYTGEAFFLDEANIDPHQDELLWNDAWFERVEFADVITAHPYLVDALKQCLPNTIFDALSSQSANISSPKF